MPIPPSMFNTWPAKSEMGHRKKAKSPTPPVGGAFQVCTAPSSFSTWCYKVCFPISQFAEDGPGFNLKF